MFKCEKCGNTSEPNTRQIKIVLDKRDKMYYNAFFKNRTGRRQIIGVKDYILFDQLKKEGWELIKEKESKGWEIVSEMNICEKCIP